MREVNSVRLKVERTGRAALLDVSLFDAVSLEWVPGAGGASSAILEASKSYAGVSGQAVAFGTAATLSESTRRRVALDVTDTPWLDIEVTTAGGTDEVGSLHVYGYNTT
jgi:hypothetical protein